MCLILYKPKSLSIKEDLARSIFERAWAGNPHGFGLAVYKGRTWAVWKGMDRNEASSRFMQAATSKNPMVAHWRMATHGTIDVNNCHPFPLVFRDARAYLFHNGVLDIEARGQKSDTATFARVVSDAGLTLQQFNVLLEGGIFDGVIGGSRLAICIDGRPEPTLVGHWIERSGLHYSNSSLLYTAERTTPLRVCSWEPIYYRTREGERAGVPVIVSGAMKALDAVEAAIKSGRLTAGRAFVDTLRGVVGIRNGLQETIIYERT